jgi:hypothetical protein
MIAETDHAEPTGEAEWRADLRHDAARYDREWAYYPQYYIAAGDVDERFLVDGTTSSASQLAHVKLAAGL